MLPSASTTEQEIARAKDNARIARDCLSWYPIISNVTDTHYHAQQSPTCFLVRPPSMEKNDGILMEAKASCKTAIIEHLNSTGTRSKLSGISNLRSVPTIDGMHGELKKTFILNETPAMTRAAQEIHTPTTQKQCRSFQPMVFQPVCILCKLLL